MLLEKGGLVVKDPGQERRVVDLEMAQAELAGPLTRGRDAADAAALIGSVAGAAYPHIEALLAAVAMQTTVEEDFDAGLRMLLDGIATRRTRKGR
jgi:hypothetical protein